MRAVLFMTFVHRPFFKNMSGVVSFSLFVCFVFRCFFVCLIAFSFMDWLPPLPPTSFTRRTADGGRRLIFDDLENLQQQVIFEDSRPRERARNANCAIPL